MELKDAFMKWEEPQLRRANPEKPFISLNPKRGVLYFTGGFLSKFNLGLEAFKIAFSIDGEDTVFCINPKNSNVPFYQVIKKANNQTYVSNKALVSKLVQAFDLKPGMSYLQPHYFGEVSGLILYKIIVK